MAQILSRAVLIVVCTLAGYVLVRQLDLFEPREIGFAIGFGMAVLVLLVEAAVKNFSAKAIVGGTLGMVLGMILAFLISYPLGRFMNSMPMAVSVYGITACMFGYIGVTLGSRKIHEVRHQSFGFLSADEGRHGEDKFLDTSALIDGRVAEVIESGFLGGRLLVPRFILNELQAIADSTDPLRRQRGRRGLEILAKLKGREVNSVEVIDEDPVGEFSVDHKLVTLARKRGAAIITTDYNLNQIAQLQGIRVLNVNLLAQALRPVFLPGEILKVQIVREGKSPGQGVGYLEDGTMVVVENGRRHLGREVEVAVTSVLQTPAGRMIFTDPVGASHNGRNRATAG